VFGKRRHVAGLPRREIVSCSRSAEPAIRTRTRSSELLQRGAWADMLLVNGDPTQDIDLLKDYDRNLAVIIKNGKIWKNMLGH
jgi:hypothetical protein